MRRLASFDDPESAHALSELLYAANISSELRSGPDRACTVWVLAEPDLPRAQALLQDFISRPDASVHRRARELAHATRAAADADVPSDQTAPARREAMDAAPRRASGGEPRAGAARRPDMPRPSLWQRARASPVTFGLIALCLVVALATQLGDDKEIVSWLSIVSFEQSGRLLRWQGYHDLLAGQLWRLVTPILLHFGPFHLLFNVFWLSDLGAPTERYQGSLRFALFIVWSAALSNIAQLVFGETPTFGGMSGIVYALVGYLWARGRFDPRSGIALPGQLVAFFVIWMLLGFTRLLDRVIGPMANYCHLGGFVAGAVYGFTASVLARARRR